MKTNFDIEQLIGAGAIASELDYERAMIADRKLRLLAKDNLHFKNLRKKLRDLIEAYETKAWSDPAGISAQQLAESELAEKAAEEERLFIETRKTRIRQRMKTFDLTQENLGVLLGHRSKTHMSELMNGIKPFTLKDLVIISKLLQIDIRELVPVYLSKEDQQKIRSAVIALNKPGIRLSENGLALIA